MSPTSSLSIGALCLALSGTALADFRADFAVVKGNAGDNVPGVSRIELSGAQMRTDAGNVSMLFDTRSGAPRPAASRNAP